MQQHEADSLSEQIARHISEQIIRGELVEGERIQELRIASELDVSRGSVREALLILERTQLIEIFPRRGAIVSEMSALQVRSLFDMAAHESGAQPIECEFIWAWVPASKSKTSAPAAPAATPQR